jgi:hypothetical protein
MDAQAAAVHPPTEQQAAKQPDDDASTVEPAEAPQTQNTLPPPPIASTSPTAPVKPVSGRSAASHASGKSADELTAEYLQKRRASASSDRQLNDAAAELPPPTTSGRSTVLGTKPRALRQSTAMMDDPSRDPYHVVPVHGATLETNVAGIKQWDRKWYYPGPGTYRLPQNYSRYGNEKGPAYSLTGCVPAFPAAALPYYCRGGIAAGG